MRLTTVALTFFSVLFYDDSAGGYILTNIRITFPRNASNDCGVEFCFARALLAATLTFFEFCFAMALLVVTYYSAEIRTTRPESRSIGFGADATFSAL